MAGKELTKRVLGGERTVARHLSTGYETLLLCLLVFSPVVVWQITGLPKPAVKQAFGELLIVCMGLAWLLRMNETGAWKVRVSALTVGIGLFVLVGALSATVAQNRGYALRSVRAYVFPAILYFVVRNGARDERRIRNCLVAMTAAGFLVSGYGLLESAGTDFMGWCDDKGMRVLAPSSFDTPRGAADFLVTVFPMSVALVLYARSVAGKLCAGIVSVVTLLHLRLTMSTEPLVALEVALGVGLLVVCLGWILRSRVNQTRLRRAGVRMVVAAVLLAIALGATHVSARLRNSSEPLRWLSAQRQEQRMLRNASWLCAARMAIARPVLGSGAGSYQTESPLFWNDFQKRWFARYPEAQQAVDNEYLTAGAETGVLGAGSLALIVSVAGVYAILACMRAASDRRLYLAAGAGCSLLAAAITAFTSSSFHEPAVLFRVFVLLALVEVLSSVEIVSVGDSAVRRPWLARVMYYPVWGIAVVVVAFVLPIVVRPLAYYQHIESARDYVALEMPDKAKAELDAAKRIYQSDWEPRALRAKILAGEGELAAAVWEYGAATMLNRNHLVALVNRGRAFLQRGRAGDAVVPLERAAMLNPYLTEARYSLGEAYAAVGNWAGALENFVAAESGGFSDRALLCLNVAKCYYHLGDFKRTDERLQAALEIEPANPHLWYEIGQLQLESKNAKGALAALKNAVRLAEREPIERNQLISAYCQLVHLNLDETKDILAASHCAVQAADLGGDNAQVKEAVKRLLDAVQSDTVRRESGQHLPMVFYNLAACVVASHIPGDVISFLEEAVRLAEKDQPPVARDAHVRLAELKLASGHYRSASAHLDAAERIDSMNGAVFRVRGQVYEALEMRGKARESYMRALSIQPSDTRSKTALLRLAGLPSNRG